MKIQLKLLLPMEQQKSTNDYYYIVEWDGGVKCKTCEDGYHYPYDDHHERELVKRLCRGCYNNEIEYDKNDDEYNDEFDCERCGTRLCIKCCNLSHEQCPDCKCVERNYSYNSHCVSCWISNAGYSYKKKKEMMTRFEKIEKEYNKTKKLPTV